MELNKGLVCIFFSAVLEDSKLIPHQFINMEVIIITILISIIIIVKICFHNNDIRRCRCKICIEEREIITKPKHAEKINIIINQNISLLGTR
jgi:hypothetical protein